ncbi:hypothetical protein, partial [Bacillus sp. SD088]|uniref:hypothetical protein n=1 Tax=Bacillus sp. SD088 TaxID=2782012 RepID=UPI001A970664
KVLFPTQLLAMVQKPFIQYLLTFVSFSFQRSNFVAFIGDFSMLPNLIPDVNNFFKNLFGGA